MARPFKGTTFWDRVYAHTVRVGACLIFNGHRDECGYGRISKGGRLVRVHREVWIRDNGPLGDGLVVMHSCDNPACIEPSHLSAGTQPDNIRDMDRKGRRISLRGAQQAQAKLTEGAVLRIKECLTAGATCAALARQYGVSDAAIRNVKKGRRWRHVA